MDYFKSIIVIRKKTTVMSHCTDISEGYIKAKIFSDAIYISNRRNVHYRYNSMD